MIYHCDRVFSHVFRFGRLYTNTIYQYNLSKLLAPNKNQHSKLNVYHQSHMKLSTTTESVATIHIVGKVSDKKVTVKVHIHFGHRNDIVFWMASVIITQLFQRMYALLLLLVCWFKFLINYFYLIDIQRTKRIGLFDEWKLNWNAWARAPRLHKRDIPIEIHVLFVLYASLFLSSNCNLFMGIWTIGMFNLIAFILCVENHINCKHLIKIDSSGEIKWNTESQSQSRPKKMTLCQINRWN